MLLLLVYLFVDKMFLRKVGFFGGILFFVMFIFSNLFAWQQKQELLFRRGAVVTATSASVMKTPTANGTEQFVLHEGTRVDITDDTMRDWKGIRLADGKEGWIQSSKIEKI